MAMTATVTPPVATTDTRWLYQMQVPQALPLVSLDTTPLSSFVTPAQHERFLSLMRQYYARFGTMYRISGVFMLTVLFVPRNTGYWLTAPTVLLACPVMLCSTVMHTTDMLKLLVRQYEFWFFTIMNTINWGCLASFYSDLRVFSLLGGILGTQMVIIMDANFRTVTSGIRSTIVATPVLLALGIAAFFRVIDTDASNYRVIPVAKVKVSLVDVFTNTAITLAVFIARKGYSKLKVLVTRSTGIQTIRCVVYRSKLQLHKAELPAGAEDTAVPLSRTVLLISDPSMAKGVMQLNTAIAGSSTVSDPITLVTASFTRPLASIPQLHCISDESTTTSSGPAAPTNASELCATADGQQQLTLVSLQLPIVDMRETLVPRLSRLHSRTPQWLARLLYAVAIVGFVCTSITLTTRHVPGEETSAAEWTAAILSITCTTTFFTVFAVSYHRALLKSLWTNFDFLFSSVQFTLAMLLISDMVQWDFRVCGAMAWLLWFHFVLMLDALTPLVKHNLWFRKYYALPVILLTLSNVVLIIYAFFFADAADFFIERTIWEVTVSGKTVGLRTKSLLLNRLFTIILWSCRLVYEVAVCDDCELIFIRGGLDYFTCLEMFPPIAPVRTKDVESSKRWWFGRKGSVKPEPPSDTTATSANTSDAYTPIQPT